LIFFKLQKSIYVTWVTFLILIYLEFLILWFTKMFKQYEDEPKLYFTSD